MTNEREKLIRDHWHWQRGWPTETDVLCVPVQRPVPRRLALRPKTVSEKVDILEFRREYGRQDGRKARRTVCEGVVVEIAFID